MAALDRWPTQPTLIAGMVVCALTPDQLFCPPSKIFLAQDPNTLCVCLLSVRPEMNAPDLLTFIDQAHVNLSRLPKKQSASRRSTSAAETHRERSVSIFDPLVKRRKPS
ncbi:hypothetical protein [Roseateles sp. P5_E8]